MSTMMVSSTLKGLKDQTRRLKGLEKINVASDEWEFYAIGKETIVKTGNESIVAKFKHNVHGYYTSVKLPWWREDILWVRESWQIHSWDFEDGFIDVKYATGEIESTDINQAGSGMYSDEWLWRQVKDLLKKEVFVARDQNSDPVYYDRTEKIQPFKPSIHMPKEASRIWLQVEEIRVERLMNISDEDAKAEGILRHRSEVDGRFRYKDYLADARGYGDPEHDYPTVGIPVTSFCTLWEKINGPESWYNNPWVWVIKFKVLSTTGRPNI